MYNGEMGNKAIGCGFKIAVFMKKNHVMPISRTKLLFDKCFGVMKVIFLLSS